MKNMATYICSMRLTQQGIKNIKDAPRRLERGSKALESMGGRVIGFYAVMGEYDYIAIAEAPNDHVAATYLLMLDSQGYVRTTMLKHSQEKNSQR